VLPPSAKRLAEWAERFVQQGIEQGAMTPAALTRAADYLYRGDFWAAAGLAARQAAERARSLLPACVMGLRAAMQGGDREEGLWRTEQAIAAALRPPPILLEKLVVLKSAREPVDTDDKMVEALKGLRRADPNDPVWAQMLGYVRFQRGGADIIDALDQMTAALERGATNRTPFLIAAEAARLLGRYDRGEEIIRAGMERHPDDLEMLNNLIYTLAFMPERIGEALDRIPVLLHKAQQNPEVLDTASAVYTRARLLDEAERTLDQILAQVKPHTRFWFRARSRKAEIALLRGEYAAAAVNLRELVGHSAGMPDEDTLNALRLMQEAEESRLRKEGLPEENESMSTNRLSRPLPPRPRGGA